MEKKTEDFINKLSQLSTTANANTYILNEHQTVMDFLKAKGIKFHPEKSPKSLDIVEGQNFSGEGDVQEVRYYEELNFIRRGVIDAWATNIDETERFMEIEVAITDIFINFK